MSHRSTPNPAPGYASPSAYSPAPGTPTTPTAAARSGTPSSSPTKTAGQNGQASNGQHKPKPVNVFSNDGSFLERFQRIQKDEEDKKKQEEILANKRNFDNRFKKRGKRTHSDSAEPTDAASELPVKKSKTETPMTQYEKEMKLHAARSLKDNGIGVRPLVK